MMLIGLIFLIVITGNKDEIKVTININTKLNTKTPGTKLMMFILLNSLLPVNSISSLINKLLIGSIVNMIKAVDTKQTITQR